MFENAKIGHLLIGFSLLLFLTAFVGYTGYSSIQSIDKSVTAVDNMSYIEANMINALFAEKDYIIYSEVGKKDDVYHYMDLVSKQATISKKVYVDPENKAQMDDVLEATANYRSAFDKYVQLNEDEIVLNKKLQLEGETLIQMVEEFHGDQLKGYEWYSQSRSSYELTYQGFQEVKNSDILYYNTIEAIDGIFEYIILGDQEYANGAEELLGSVIKQATNMSSVSEEADEIEKLNDIVIKATETRANFQQLISLNQQKAEVEGDMQLSASQIEGAVAAALDDLDKKESSQVAKATNTIILVTFFSLLIGTLLVMGILRLFRKPINELLEAADRISKGDLSVEISETSRNEVAQLSRVFRQMVENLRQLIGHIQDGSTRLASMSEEMSASSEEMAAASKRISDAVTEISEGSHSQASKIVDATHAMRDMTQNVQEIAENSQNASKNTNFVNAIMHNLGSNSQEVLVKMDRIQSSVDEASEVIRALDEKSRKINEIVTFITGISDQTNMLALNAAIEAARAGEHGRGFSVVADEVRKLAEESGSSAKEISVLIEEIRSGINAAVECIETSKDDVQKGYLSVSEVTEEVKGVVSTINDITNMIEGIAAAAQEQSASIEEITSTVEDISAISEDSASGTTEVAAAVEEQTSSLAELADAAHELASLAENMMTATARFKIDSSREEPDSGRETFDSGREEPDSGRETFDSGREEPEPRRLEPEPRRLESEPYTENFDSRLEGFDVRREDDEFQGN